jgi:hypothetical protein
MAVVKQRSCAEIQMSTQFAGWCAQPLLLSDDAYLGKRSSSICSCILKPLSDFEIRFIGYHVSIL